MGYSTRKENKSGFESYCRVELSRVKHARMGPSLHKAAKQYQQCLCEKGIKTGISEKEARKIRKANKK